MEQEGLANATIPGSPVVTPELMILKFRTRDQNLELKGTRFKILYIV